MMQLDPASAARVVGFWPAGVPEPERGSGATCSNSIRVHALTGSPSGLNSTNCTSSRVGTALNDSNAPQRKVTVGGDLPAEPVPAEGTSIILNSASVIGRTLGLAGLESVTSSSSSTVISRGAPPTNCGVPKLAPGTLCTW